MTASSNLPRNYISNCCYYWESLKAEDLLTFAIGGMEMQTWSEWYFDLGDGLPWLIVARFRDGDADLERVHEEDDRRWVREEGGQEEELFLYMTRNLNNNRKYHVIKYVILKTNFVWFKILI